jgi:hypothetical protein
VLLAFGLALAACGGGGGAGSSVTVPVAKGENASTGLVPNPDGFAFPNFGSSGSPEVFNENDLVTMFGSGPDVCEGGVSTPCVPTAEAAAWARMVNQAREAGHCEGFAVLSASRFAGKESPKTVELLNQGDVTHGIMRAFATQFLKETQDNTKSWAKRSLGDIVATLENSFASGEVGYSLGVYSDLGGHAVLPYAIEYDSPEQVRIKIYDSNWPGEERFVFVDLAANEWRFSFFGSDPLNDPDAWVGGPGDLDITAMSARESGTCPFCSDATAVDKSLLVIRSLRPDWSIDTPGGTVTATSNTVEGVTVRPLRSSALTDASVPVDFMIEISTAESVSLVLPSPTRISGMTPTGVVEIDSPSDQGGSATIEDDRVTTESSEVRIAMSSGNRGAAASGGVSTIAIEPDQIAAQVTTSAGTEVQVESTDETRLVEVVGRDEGNVDYEVVTQSGPTEIARRVVSVDGTETSEVESGVMRGQTVADALPEVLQGPDVKPGLPPASERTIGGVPVTTTTVATSPTSSTSTTSTTVATATTANRPTQTTRPSATTSPATPTTQAQNASARKAAVINVNVAEWSPGISDPMSSGFSARLSGGAGQLDSVPGCGDVGCLESLRPEILGGGTDSATGGDTTVPVTFTMSGVPGTFSVRCGNGSWVSSSGSGGSQSASCSFGNVTSDVTVYIRA